MQLAMLIVVYLCFSFHLTASAPNPFVIGTWNTYDVYYGADRDARRDYYFTNKEELFGDLDIFCTQESHTYASINDFNTNFGSIFPYSFYHNDPSSSYQACLLTEIADFEDDTSEIYNCNTACTASLPSTLGYIFCLWRCFGELRDNVTGITTRSNNPELFDLGKELELSPCLTCLWKSNYIDPMSSTWDINNSTNDEMFDDILDSCVSTTNTFDYKANEGIMLWSKYAFDSVEFVELSDAVFTSRGYIHAVITDDSIIGDNPLNIICTHLETPTINAYFGGQFTTMQQDNIDNAVTEMSNITQLEIAELINVVDNIVGDIIILGDLNIGINSRIDIYNELLENGNLRNVFGTNDELISAVNCSRCNTNPFTSNNEIVDHILINGDNINVNYAQRFLDEKYNTSAGLIPLSDHYGIKATLYINKMIISISTSTETTADNDSNSIIIEYFISSVLVLFIVCMQ